ITANNQTKCFGETFTFNGTEFTSSGLVSGDAITSVSLSSAATSSSAAAGAYSISASSASGTGLTNYNISYTNGSFTVRDLPTAAIAGDTTICSGNSAVINFTGTANARITYTINSGSNKTIDLDGS